VRVVAGLRAAPENKLEDPTRLTLNAFSVLRARGRHTDAAIAGSPSRGSTCGLSSREAAAPTT